ncbi:MAG: acyl-CoA dehydratase activase [Nitrospirota bacterium]|jgi:predicted CoA-substrate-specific enzyme activase
MRFLGLDAGSVSVKVVVLDESGAKIQGHYRKHHGHPLETALEMLKEFPCGENCSVAVTGSAGRLIADALGIEPINEIVAQAYATMTLYPRVKTVIEMGGEDSKLIVLGEKAVKDFSMNSVCAAGTGSFLDQQAERLRLGIEEFSEMALAAKKPPRVAGRCSVFAKSDMIHLQQIATPMEDIVAGLCFAVARNFRGTICRGRNIVEPVSFQGGVAANKGMVRAFREVFGLADLLVPGDFALMGAWGGALKARDEGAGQPLRLERLQEHLRRERAQSEGNLPLRTEGDGFYERHLKDPRDVVVAVNGGPPVRACMGIDIGSISTNLAVVDEEGSLLAKRYLMTAGRPIEAVRQGLREIAEEVGEKVRIMGVGTTGSGRYMIADYVGADIVKNEITAQATAAAFIDPGVDTIFEIGGQDSKFVSLRDGVIVDFEMNKACAAGTGSFLEEQAEKLRISVKEEFAQCAFSSGCPSRLGERCTVFMENSLMANLQKGAARDDLLAGLAYSIVQNYINRVVAGRHIGKNIFFQGGVAFNKSVVAAFEKYLGVQVTVPPNHDVTGAIGMALIARKYMQETGREETSFKGFDRSRTPYTMNSFECKGCSNLCEINRVQIEGEKGKLFYGGRCEKYDINRKKTTVPDLFTFREEALWKRVPTPPEQRGQNGDRKTRIGIPYVFFFNEYLPFWSTLLDELGFEAEVSPRTNRQIVGLGLESVIAESCYPAKVALGHVKYLMEKEVDAILLPSFMNFSQSGEEYHRSVACPYTQTLPYVSRVALGEVPAIVPLIDLSRGEKYMERELRRVFGPFGATAAGVGRALRAANRAQEEFYRAVSEKGREVLSGLQGKALVIVGRSYNAMEKGMNLQIPEKLATLGVPAIPMDMLPTEDIRLAEKWPNMYWRSGQKVLRAARYIAAHENLYPVFIGNFSCGPDSFVLKYFKDELGEKPFLHLEIDEHSADAGAITRCEAFLDSIENRRDARPPGEAAASGRISLKGRTIYIPRMMDHALALKAAFEKAGLSAEVMPESDRSTVDTGMRYVSGKECYPFILTTGDMVKMATSPGFVPEKSAFFMPSGDGPCRFGQYNVSHQKVLEKIGLPEVPVFAPNQDIGLYRDLGSVAKEFPLTAWKGIVAFELLQKCVHETRPYETEPGACDALYERYRDKLYLTLRDDDAGMEDVLAGMKRAFEAVPRGGEPRPLIGVVGEVYVRCNGFANEYLVRKLEALGGEVWLAPFEEWMYYVNMMSMRKGLRAREFSDTLNTLTKRYFQKKIERRYARYFEGFLHTLHEPATGEIFKQAAPYVPDSFEGETVLSVGKTVDLIRRGAAGVVNTMPFGCMPGTIVSGLMRAVSRDFDVPIISIPYDGTESSTTQIQLEAFMDQARASMMAQRR